jgi:hypothetical protein
MMSWMPGPTTVWMVHLARGESPDGVRGTLTLERESVVFTDQDLRAYRFHRSGIRRARRLRGSPVLQLDWIEAGVLRRTAFSFVQPPPLITDPNVTSLPTSPQSARPLGGFGAARKTSKRRMMRTNAGYLQLFGMNERAHIQSWAEEITRLLANGGS